MASTQQLPPEHPALPWPQAREQAWRAAEPLEPFTVPLLQAAGAVLAADARARTDLPATDTAAMDGWAVAGDPPWRIVGEVLAGALPPPLVPGTAVTIATGAAMPVGAGGVLRREWGVRVGEVVRPLPPAGARGPGLASLARDVRRAGGECRADEVVLPAGTRITPAAVGLLAAAGFDVLPVRRASVTVLILGDELLATGPARQGRIRDALGPLLAAWLPLLGLVVASVTRIPDRPEPLVTALATAATDLVISTGSTARGPVDHLHASLATVQADILVDGVAVRPGHPQVLAVLPDGRPVIGLPGNPLAAVSGLLTLVQPVVAALHADLAPLSRPGRLAVPIGAGEEATRLVPVRDGRPVMFSGPAMLRGLAAAQEVAVVPPGGLAAGAPVELLPLPGAG